MNSQSLGHIPITLALARLRQRDLERPTWPQQDSDSNHKTEKREKNKNKCMNHFKLLTCQAACQEMCA